jgi:hypothetical protein
MHFNFGMDSVFKSLEDNLADTSFYLPENEFERLSSRSSFFSSIVAWKLEPKQAVLESKIDYVKMGINGKLELVCAHKCGYYEQVMTQLNIFIFIHHDAII